ncbi:HERC4 [Mytilus edulis]|uniref:HERC4 n=1 Tax=Mytilus edulis TaxID=6550 RepID=A0A8S3UZ01_MYTED|nr:HERC4 [Mytilus edulis]
MHSFNFSYLDLSIKPCENYSNNKEPCRGDEEKGSLSKIQEKQAEKLKEINDKLGKALVAQKEIEKWDKRNYKSLNQQEFFLLLLREILDPKYGMFKFYEESRVDWFNSDSFEEPVMFYLIGCLCGLAIYNSTIIVLNFPLALYKKLLKRSPDVEDLKEVMPQLGRGLQQMMDYEEDDFEDVFCQTFEISVESFGEIKNVELCKGGSKKTVTKSNR